jgi:hypothetical protein
MDTTTVDAFGALAGLIEFSAHYIGYGLEKEELVMLSVASPAGKSPNRSALPKLAPLSD